MFLFVGVTFHRPCYLLPSLTVYDRNGAKEVLPLRSRQKQDLFTSKHVH